MRANKNKALKLIILAGYLLHAANGANNKTDRVQGLPSCGKLPSNWYSGYLNVRPTAKQLHYVFIESLSIPKNDPIVIWFNGGPGCSSLLGLFQENGPYVIDDGENIIKPNPFPWNRDANLLYIESPAGVGFSFSTDEQDSDFIHTDMTQSQDTFAALQNFYEAFPLYKSNDLWVSGESYAGIYGPYLAWQIHQWNLQQKMYNNTDKIIPLKGFMIGNGLTDQYQDSNVWYPDTLFNFNLISPTLLQKIKAKNCIWYWDKLYDVLDPHPNAPECDDYLKAVNQQLPCLNQYDLYRTNYDPCSTST